MHAGAVTHHSVTISERAAAWTHSAHIMAECFQFIANIFWYERLDAHVATGEGALRKTSGFEGLLNIETEVGDIGDELCVRLGLVESTHDTEADLYVALLHECGDDGVQRAFARREHVRVAFFEREQSAAVMQHESAARRHESAAEATVKTLDERDDVAVAI